MTLSEELRQQLQKQLSEGKQYREISKNLGISIGSISNVVKREKLKNEQSISREAAQILVPPTLTPASTTISMSNNISIDGDSSTLKGDDLVSLPNNEQEEQIDFDDQAYETVADNLLSGEYSEILDGESGERLLNYTTVEAEPEQVVSDARYDNHVVKENKKIKIKESTAARKESDQPRSRISDTDTEDSSLKLGLGVDWDEGYQNRFVKWVMQQKRARQYERGRLDIYWKRLTYEREKLEKEKRDFSDAEADLAQRIYQVKDLLPIADEIKKNGLDFSLANSWLICVGEMAQRKGLDVRSASYKLVDDLKAWQELGGFETAIQNAKNQLALLNMTLENQKAAIATLVNLQKMGMSEIEISRLVKLVNGWGKGNFANGLELDTHINLPTNPR